MKKILYIDMDNVLVDFPSAFNKVPKRYLITHKDKMDEIPGIFSLMDPIPKAIESFNQLSSFFDTYILSTSPWENPSAWTDKLNWVKKNLGASAYKRLILSHHKNLNIGDFLIDDRLANGADRFVGEHIHFGTDEFPNWEKVVSYLKQKI
jgi:5'(3')-deoxyribonucleotidase